MHNILRREESTPADSQMEAIAAGFFSKGAQRCAEDFCDFMFCEQFDRDDRRRLQVQADSFGPGMRSGVVFYVFRRARMDF
jgi:hypothetical protein